MSQFIPLFQEVATAHQDLNLSDLATFGAVWRFSQLDAGVCNMSPKNIGQHFCASEKTVRRSLLILVGANLIVDLHPDRRGHNKEYTPSEYALNLIRSGQNDQSQPQNTEIAMDKMTKAQWSKCPEQNIGSGQNDQSDESALVKMTNKDISSSSSSKGPAKKPERPPPDFGKLYTRLTNDFGNDCLTPGEIEILGDYFDENPLFAEKAIDEVIIHKPRGGIMAYFKRIMDGWLKLGYIPDRPPAKPPPQKASQNANAPPPKELSNTAREAYERIESAGLEKTPAITGRDPPT